MYSVVKVGSHELKDGVITIRISMERSMLKYNNKRPTVPAAARSGIIHNALKDDALFTQNFYSEEQFAIHILELRPAEIVLKCCNPRQG